MAVKTITIDLEAYDRLAGMKMPGQSFSDVIKSLSARSARTASALLADAEALRLEESTLATLDGILAGREEEYAAIPASDAGQ